MQVFVNVVVLCSDCQIRAPRCCGATEGETWSVARLVHLEIPVGSGAVMSSHDAPLRVKAPGGRPDPVMGALYKSRRMLRAVDVANQHDAEALCADFQNRLEECLAANGAKLSYLVFA